MLVMLLALLQCVAPLLHAHAHDVSAPGKVHFHAMEMGDAPSAPGLHELKSHLADSDAISMELASKNEPDTLIADAVQAISAASGFTLLVMSAIATLWSPDVDVFISASHFHPPSQAPPRLLFS